MKNVIKKTAVLLAFTAVATGSLASCGGKKLDTDNLVVWVADTGNGATWMEKIAENFSRDTGISVSVRSSARTDFVSTTLPSGPNNNDVDVYVSNENCFSVLAQGKNYVKGFNYDKAVADISDVYDYEVTGYGEGVTVKDVLSERAVEECTFDRDGKQYFISVLDNTVGIIYNKDVFTQQGYEVPLTTDALVSLCEEMKEDGKKAFVFAGGSGYSRYATNVWWGQYEGKQNFENFWKGIYDGSYTEGYKNFAQEGRRYAAVALDSIWGGNTGYIVAASTEYTFTRATQAFLRGDACMTISGDWIESEASGTYADDMIDMEIMQTPVLSALSTKLSYYPKDGGKYDKLSESQRAYYDAALQKIVKYVDGTTSEKPTKVDDTDPNSPAITDADIEIVRTARKIKVTDSMPIFIPSYSDKIPEAKRLLAYILNKDSQNVMLKETYGTISALKADYAIDTFDNYSALSKFQQRKVNLYKVGAPIELSKCNNYAMSYAAGLISEWYTGSGTKIDKLISLDSSYKDHKTGEQIFEQTYQYYSEGSAWTNMLKNANLLDA